MTIHSELETQNSEPQTHHLKPTTFAFLRSNILLVAILLLLVLIVIVAVNPLLALYHQQQAGRALAQILPTSENEYGGFACLRPFVEDLEQRESLKGALSRLRKAESYAPRQFHTFYLQGKTFCLLGDYENAVQAFQRFSELRPKNPLGYLEMGFALLQSCPPNGKCPDGLNTFDAWRKAGMRAEDFLAMAEKARQKEDWETALLWYQNAQRMGMELRSTVAYIRFLILRQGGKEDEAMRALQSAVEHDRGWVDGNDRCQAWLRWGASLHEQKRDRKAEMVLSEAIARCPEAPRFSTLLSEIYRFLALSQWAQGKVDQAVSNARKAVELNEKSVWAHIHYGKILYFHDPSLVKQTDHEFAVALNLSPNVEIWRNLIGFWRWVGEMEQASQLCERAITLGLSAELTEECPE